MPLASMTGFARADGTQDEYRWTWEIRSVNGKGLDIRLRLPPGLEFIELPARERLGAALTRGNVQASLSTQKQAGAGRLRINEQVLADVLAMMDKLGQRITVQPPTLDGLLSVRGIVEVEDIETDEEARKLLGAAVLESLDAAISALVADRSREGAAIGEILANRLNEIEELAQAVERSPARTVEAIRARLAEQVAALLEASGSLDPQRLHQEAVLLATRADVREELDRLYAHIAAARTLISEGGAVGRRFDFLAQEFNREVNTLCSKSNDRSITAIGLELKAVVDQLREQIQNLE